MGVTDMSEVPKITAIIGTYRKGGMIDSAVSEILSSAAQEGAQVEKIYLIDKHIEFCTNCRACTQVKGDQPGQCPIDDEMKGILETIERSDAIVLASPMNFFTVTAVMKRFMERLVCFAYWPWGKLAPKMRNKIKAKRAVVVASSAAPAFIARLMSQMVGLMKKVAGLLGAKTVGVMFIGLSSGKQSPKLSESAKAKARRFGKKLVERS